MIPERIVRMRYHRLLNTFHQLPEVEREYITMRTNYYCKYNTPFSLPEDSPTLKNFSYKRREAYRGINVSSVYFFDAYKYVRAFSHKYHWVYRPGDVNTIQDVPSIVKSRPISADNANRNNILLKLNKVRHYIWVKDPISWEDKKSVILFRGDVNNKPSRKAFLKMWQHHPLCDLAARGDMSIYEHLKYKYIMALEGNDVASNLKWLMSSNSIAVMPRPTCETWFMEGKLIPDYHYIAISDDYHDLIERITYYEEHPEEAKAIIHHAHDWVQQFQDEKRENLISMMVLQKYFKLSTTNRMKDFSV